MKEMIRINICEVYIIQKVHKQKIKLFRGPNNILVMCTYQNLKIFEFITLFILKILY